MPAPRNEPIIPDFEYRWTPGRDPKTAAEIERFFNSPEIRILKDRICDIGKRIWNKDYVDGNGGNITIRVGDNLVLCTPTLISKGFMQPEELCLVDMDGNQVAGTRKRTSEVNTHIGIMKRQPAAKSCVHAHPPHATAFAVAGVVPPTCMIPEAEVFLGQIGYAEYRTPGSQENADVVGEIGVNHQSIIMENHGSHHLGQRCRRCLLEDGEYGRLLQNRLDRLPARHTAQDHQRRPAQRASRDPQETGHGRRSS